MPIQSPLTNIVDVIRQVINSAQEYEATLHKNEAATRAVLIDPVLRALGWDTGNTFMVEVEKSLEKTRVDYALYDINSDVRVVVEAKALASGLDQRDFIISLLTYAFTYGLRDVFLTDGLLWQHFSDFHPGNVAPVKVLDLSKDDPVDCAAYLVQRLDAAKFWPQDQDIDTLAQQVAQLESTVSTLQRQFADANAARAFADAHPPTPVTYGVATHVETPVPHGPLVELASLPDLTGKRPSAFRLPDGRVIAVTTWKEVLVEACKFAMAANSAIRIPLPDRSGRKVNIFGSARPVKGISYIEAQYQGKLVYIYTNYDANNCASNANYVLQQTPKELSLAKAAAAFL